jgi:hypothetical protein
VLPFETAALVVETDRLLHQVVQYGPLEPWRLFQIDQGCRLGVPFEAFGHIAVPRDSVPGFAVGLASFAPVSHFLQLGGYL